VHRRAIKANDSWRNARARHRSALEHRLDVDYRPVPFDYLADHGNDPPID
jgi:hypothetical protein